MIKVKGRFIALVDYLGPQKSKKSTDAILYTAQDNVVPFTVREALVNEELLWVMVDDVTEAVFNVAFPKAVKVEQIFQ